LCGSYNSNMMRFAQKFIEEQKKPFEAIAVGKKSIEWFRKQEIKPRAEYQQLPTEIPFSQIKAMTKQLVDMFVKGEVDEVHLLFTRYVNAMTFKPGSVKFLPIEPEKTEKKLAHEYEFEPEPASILDKLIPRYVEASFHRLLLEAMSSEHAARMTAMRNATDSASASISSLTLRSHNARQAGITKELL